LVKENLDFLVKINLKIINNLTIKKKIRKYEILNGMKKLTFVSCNSSILISFNIEYDKYPNNNIAIILEISISFLLDSI
jgi:hypothetical protein